MKPQKIVSMPYNESAMRKRLTTNQVFEIVRRYPNETAAALASEFEVPLSRIYKTAQRYNVKKSPEFMASAASGRIKKGERRSTSTEFKKGDQSATKGKRLEAMIKNKAKLEKWKAGLWKPGNKPYNTAKDGEVRWRKNPGYYFIRLSENNWEFYHRYVWHKHNGKVPEGYNVVFKDGNHRNCDIANLECISNKELCSRNSIVNYPPDLRQLMQTTGRLNKEINNQKKV